MPGSNIHTLRYFSGFWARRATPDRVLKILAGGYFDIKRGYGLTGEPLRPLDIWAMWEYRRVRHCGGQVYPAGEGLPDGVSRRSSYTQDRLFRQRCGDSLGGVCYPVWETKPRGGRYKKAHKGPQMMVKCVWKSMSLSKKIQSQMLWRRSP